MSNDIELILADYIQMGAPSMEDQKWIANYSAKILQYSKLKKVANLLASDIFQQIAIEVIYETASEIPLPRESKYFLSQEDAMDWLLQD
ncbi:hypothetical protein [Pontibacter sp. H249]|uniref:hypothetical protein n=1 Tax=Pontibacter sp. H249 TaxID=3133420 RepID=UPI0030C19BD9